MSHYSVLNTILLRQVGRSNQNNKYAIDYPWNFAITTLFISFNLKSRGNYGLEINIKLNWSNK